MINDSRPISRIAGFYELSLDERDALLIQSGVLSADDLATLKGKPGLSLEGAQHMIENVVGTYALPMGLGLNFQVNGRDVIIPMVVEEPSIVAGASFMAKLARAGGGFTAETTAPEMIGQIQILDVKDLPAARSALLAHKEVLLAQVSDIDPILKKLGGGPRDFEVRQIDDSAIGPFLVVHLIYDVRDAMGANAVNTACEHLAPRIEAISGGRVHLRIISNLADRRLARVRCMIPLEKLAFRDHAAEDVRDGIIAAWAFAEADPYRAATHNKGIMNGIDAVVLATGNDWRAIEAGAHAYAAREAGNLVGSLEMPMAVGIVGGATKVHPCAQIALKIMDVTSANQLAEIMVSVGLAQNLAALRALATEGIQRGHMTLHARQVAIAAGAEGDQIPWLARKLVDDKMVRIDRAREILEDLEK